MFAASSSSTMDPLDDASLDALIAASEVKDWYMLICAVSLQAIVLTLAAEG